MSGFLPLGRGKEGGGGGGGGGGGDEEEEGEEVLSLPPLSLLFAVVVDDPLTLTQVSGSHGPSSRAPPPSGPPMHRENGGGASSVGSGGSEDAGEEEPPLLPPPPPPPPSSSSSSAPAARSCEGKPVLEAPIPRIPSATCWKISPVSLVVQPKVTGTRRYGRGEGGGGGGGGGAAFSPFFAAAAAAAAFVPFPLLLLLAAAAAAAAILLAPTRGRVTTSVTSLPDALDSSAYSLLQVQFPSRLASSESGLLRASQPHCCLLPHEHRSASPHSTRRAVALAAASKPEAEECLGPQSPEEAHPAQAT